MDYTIGVCFVFAVECHFSFQKIVCRREEELEDDKTIEIFRNIALFSSFSPFLNSRVAQNVAVY